MDRLHRGGERLVALQGDAQSQCKKTADANYAAAKQSAQQVRDSEKQRGEEVQKLDNK